MYKWICAVQTCAIHGWIAVCVLGTDVNLEPPVISGDVTFLREAWLLFPAEGKGKAPDTLSGKNEMAHAGSLTLQGLSSLP